MNRLKTNYDDVITKDYEHELESLFQAIKINDYDSVENLFSEVFIYSIEHDEFLKDITDILLNEDASFKIKAKIAFETALYFQNNNSAELATYYFNIAIENQMQHKDEDNLTLALIYMHLKEYDKAIEEFLTCDLTNRDIVLRTAECYSLNKDYKKAIDICEANLDINPKYSDYYYINKKIGWNYMYLNEFDLAESYFIKANMVNNIHLLIDVSDYYRQIGNKERMLTMFYYMYDLGETSITIKIDELEQELGTKRPTK